MANLINKTMLKILKDFIPINVLNEKNFQKLTRKACIEQVPSGGIIFKKGDNDRKSVYLMEGRVKIMLSADKHKTIVSDTHSSKRPLANQQPRKHTAIAVVDSKIIRLDSDLLDILLTWDHISGVKVDEIQTRENVAGDDSDDWMTRILQSTVFQKIPPENIQTLFMKVREIPVKRGDIIIKQGDKGDYYYIIKHGKCKVTRNSKMGTELTLAKLAEGDTFGEEALLSGKKRNANVVMVTDGSLMRLAKKDFDELLKKPMLSWVNNGQADDLVRNEGAVWIDIRSGSEHKNSAIKGSINIPLFMLRLRMHTLDPKKQYILYCDSGNQSSAGAYLLSECGLTVHCLKGGLPAHLRAQQAE